MQSTDTRSAMVELIKSESERVKEYINSLPTEALTLPTPCPMWNVGEVVAHLDWFAETYGGMMERGLSGDLSPTEGFPAPDVLSGEQIHELYGQAAITLRRSLGENLFSAFNNRYDWLNHMLSGISPDDWDKPCYHTRRIRSVESFIPTIFTELAVHEWDIRSALEPSLPCSRSAFRSLSTGFQTERGPGQWISPPSQSHWGLSDIVLNRPGRARGCLTWWLRTTSLTWHSTEMPPPLFP